jgi:hypothetical protein
MRKQKQPRVYAAVIRRFYRPEMTICPTCQTPLRRYATLSQRTVITLDGPVRLIHRGFRCPNVDCPTRFRSYRSAAADALALPGFTFGVEVVILVGHLRLAQHQTLDEVHQGLLERLAPFALTISRREVLYLFDAYCTLLQAASAACEDHEWLRQVEANGGLIISIDGIQPDKGNETIYLVRDALTGRLLTAENVLSSEKEVMKRVLAPVVALGVPVLGAISDAQEALQQAIADLWPSIPHQLCQYHVLREASRPIYEQDRKLKVEMRKPIQERVRKVRKQLEQQRQTATGPEAEQLAVVADYALGIQTAIKLEGKQPFDYAGLAAYDALMALHKSLKEIEKKGQQ